MNLKTRFELIGDIDYLNKLTEAEKEYLNAFYEEYVNTNFKHEGKRIHPKVESTKVVKTTGEKKSVDVYKRESEHRNNARNRCVYTRAKAAGMVADYSENKDCSGNSSLEEDKFLDEIQEKLLKKFE